MRIVLRGLLVALAAGLTLQVGALEAQEGCATCMNGQCYIGSGHGVIDCEEWGGACLVGGDCCYGEGCPAPPPPKQTLLDGSVAPVSRSGLELLRFPSDPLPRVGAVVARLCQGDIVQREYGAARMVDIRRSTRQLML